MKKIFFLILIFLFLIPFQAAARQWKLDMAHTNFYFDAKHTYATVRGVFTDFSGEVEFDPDDPAKSRFDFDIRVNSVDTGIGKRDTHLRSPDFFDASTYPLITFRSSKVTHGADKTYLVEGTLTIKDVSRDIALEFVYHGQKENPVKKGEIVAGLDATLIIDRLEYHVGDGKFYTIGVVDKYVNIVFTMELLRDR